MARAEGRAVHLDPGSERRPLSSPASPQNQQPTHTPAALIAFAWALVGVPLAYGLYNAVKAASALFGG